MKLLNSCYHLTQNSCEVVLLGVHIGRIFFFDIFPQSFTFKVAATPFFQSLPWFPMW